MTQLIKANEASANRRRIYFHLVGSDGTSPALSEAGGQPQISINGAAWSNTGIGVLVAIGNGRYYAQLTQAAVANAGDIIESRYKSLNTLEIPGDSVQVVAFDPTALSALSVAMITPLTAQSELVLFRGNDYYTTETRQIDFYDTGNTWPADLTGATARLDVFLAGSATKTRVFTQSATILQAVSPPQKHIQVQLPHSQTLLLNVGARQYVYEVIVNFTSLNHDVTVQYGPVLVK